MVEIPDGVSFPVVFFDGERETEIGSIAVYPAMEFKRFQALLSQKIGISPHQFSVHLSSPESGWRIPITGKVNFGAISREKGCFFDVVLKRSSGQRRRKGGGRRNLQDYHDDVGLYSKGDLLPPMVRNKNPPPNVMLLRRDATAAGEPPLFSDRVGYESRVMNLQLERERYLMNMGLSGLGPEPTSPGSASAMGGGGGSGSAVCEDCARAKELGREAGFHWCVYDAVTFGFRSSAGPISRPTRGSE